MYRGFFPDATEESPAVEIAHFVCVCGVDWVAGQNKEFMTS